jgi:hypothetical protein
VVPEPKGTHVSGVTRWLSSNKTLIKQSLHHKTDDHFWFTFFHEAGRILLHGKKEAFLETNDPERHYWCASFLSHEIHLEGHVAMPELALLLLQQGICICQEADDDENMRFQMVSLTIQAANLSQRLGLQRQAQHYKRAVKETLMKDPILAGGWPAMDEKERILYESIVIDGSKRPEQKTQPAVPAPRGQPVIEKK